MRLFGQAQADGAYELRDFLQRSVVASLNRPGGNVTGVTNLSGGLMGTKEIGFLRELVPTALSVGCL